MTKAPTLLGKAIRVVCTGVLLAAAPASAAALQAADEIACQDEPACVELLEDGIDLIEAGRWEAASVLLQAVAAGLEGRASHVRELARALVHLGVARLQIADADETRQLFAEAQVRDPALQLDPAEFPRDVLEIWDEARELGVLVVESEPPGAEVSVAVAETARPLGQAVAEAVPSDVLTTAERVSADTVKGRGRSVWRTLAGVLAVAGGTAAIATRGCTVGAASLGRGTPVDLLGGIVQTGGFRSWNGAGCPMEYTWDYRSDVAGVQVVGTVADHELLKAGDRSALSLNPDFSNASDSTLDMSLFQEQLPDALIQSVGGIRSSRIPTTRLIGGLALVGAGALLATIWSEGGVVVEDVAVSVPPAGGVLASRSFSW